MKQMIYEYHLVGHKILNKALYSLKRYYFQILRYLRKCMKNSISSNDLKYSFINNVMNMQIVCKTAMPYIMIDVIAIS